jgi:hypothetical protein
MGNVDIAPCNRHNNLHEATVVLVFSIVTAANAQPAIASSVIHVPRIQGAFLLLAACDF